MQGVAPQYAEVLAAAGAGSKTQAERVAAAPAFANFFLKVCCVAWIVCVELHAGLG